MDNQWKDKFNSLFSFCGNEWAVVDCGYPTVYLEKIGDTVNFNISSMSVYGDSCTYRIISNCGYPKIQVNAAIQDVVVASVQNSSMWEKNNKYFQFDQKFTKILKPVNDTMQYVFGEGNNEVEDDKCGVNRTIIMTISNLYQPV
jgi:hypothetical protein